MSVEQMKLMNQRQKKAHIMEIQVNGGSISDKIDWAKEQLEKPHSIGKVFSQDEMLDIIGVTKGHGFKGELACPKRGREQFPKGSKCVLV